jgi:multiple sugar transport system permease protein
MLYRSSRRFILLTLSPIILYLVFIFYYSFGYNLVLSLHKTNLLTDNEFVGLRNFRNLFADPEFKVSIVNNLKYWIGLVFGGLIVSLFFSWLISLVPQGFKKIVLFLFFTPVVTSMIASALVWQLLYYPDLGFFSTILKKAGFGSQSFLSDPKKALWCINIMEVWKELGIRVAIFLAAMEQIPDSIYEAADLDGAGEGRKFLRITFPLLRPQILFIIVVFSINALKVFSQVYMMTPPPGGGPGNSTKVLNLMLYQQSFRTLKFGYGASISMVIFFMLFVFVLFEIRIITRKEKRVEY